MCASVSIDVCMCVCVGVGWVGRKVCMDVRMYVCMYIYVCVRV